MARLAARGLATDTRWTSQAQYHDRNIARKSYTTPPVPESERQWNGRCVRTSIRNVYLERLDQLAAKRLSEQTGRCQQQQAYIAGGNVLQRLCLY